MGLPGWVLDSEQSPSHGQVISDGGRHHHLQDLQRSWSCTLMLQGTRCLQPPGSTHGFPKQNLLQEEHRGKNLFFPHMATARAHSAHKALQPSDICIQPLTSAWNVSSKLATLKRFSNSTITYSIFWHSYCAIPTHFSPFTCQFSKSEEKAVANVEHFTCHTSWLSSLFGSILKLWN